MKIESLSYFDHAQGWGFENLEFDKLNLLVGASGVGKTQILRAITNIQSIIEGEYHIGVYWKITFHTNTEKKYIWEGEFARPTDFDLVHEEEKNIICEKLTLNEDVIFSQEKANITFRGNLLPFYNKKDILLNFFSEDDEVKEVFYDLKKILLFDNSYQDYKLYEHQVEYYTNEIKDLEKLRVFSKRHQVEAIFFTGIEKYK